MTTHCMCTSFNMIPSYCFPNAVPHLMFRLTLKFSDKHIHSVYISVYRDTHCMFISVEGIEGELKVANLSPELPV